MVKRSFRPSFFDPTDQLDIFEDIKVNKKYPEKLLISRCELSKNQKLNPALRAFSAIFILRLGQFFLILREKIKYIFTKTKKNQLHLTV